MPPTINYASTFWDASKSSFDNESWLSCLPIETIEKIILPMLSGDQNNVFLAFPRIARRVEEEDAVIDPTRMKQSVTQPTAQAQTQLWSERWKKSGWTQGLRGFTPLMTRLTCNDTIAGHMCTISARKEYRWIKWLVNKYQPSEIEEAFPFEVFGDTKFVLAMVKETGAAVVPVRHCFDMQQFRTLNHIKTLLPVVNRNHVEAMIEGLVDAARMMMIDVRNRGYEHIRCFVEDGHQMPKLRYMMDTETSVPCCSRSQMLDKLNDALLHTSTHGKIGVLELTKQLGRDPSISIMQSAIRSSHTETVEWFLCAYKNDERYRLSSDIVDQATKLGNMDIVRALIREGYACDTNTKMSFATSSGDRKLVVKLLDDGFTWNEDRHICVPSHVFASWLKSHAKYPFDIQVRPPRGFGVR